MRGPIDLGVGAGALRIGLSSTDPPFGFMLASEPGGQVFFMPSDFNSPMAVSPQRTTQAAGTVALSEPDAAMLVTWNDTVPVPGVTLVMIGWPVPE